MTIKFIICSILLVFATSAWSMPKINVKHQRNANGYAEAQISNLTMERLICHVAIDGHKLLFKLDPMGFSRWYTATDTRHNHTHFSVWCDYLKLHPQHQ